MQQHMASSGCFRRIRVASPDPNQGGALAVPIAIFVLLCAGVAASGWWYYQFERRHMIADVVAHVAALSAQKADQIQKWRDDHLHDLRRAADSPYVRRAVAQLAGGTLDGPGRDELREDLAVLRTEFDYEAVAIVDREGKVLFAVSDQAVPMPASCRALAAGAGKSGRGRLGGIEFVGFE
jgi:hypothetical protein